MINYGFVDIELRFMPSAQALECTSINTLLSPYHDGNHDK